MAHEMKTSTGQRNVLVQNGHGESHMVWLEVELLEDLAGITCLALTPGEADALAGALYDASGEASARWARKNRIIHRVETLRV